MTRRRVIEANDAADDRRRGHSRGADQTLALAVRDQRKVSGPQVTGVRALDFVGVRTTPGPDRNGLTALTPVGV